MGHILLYLNIARNLIFICVHIDVKWPIITDYDSLAH